MPVSGGKGGGNTKSGKDFEDRLSLAKLLQEEGYDLIDAVQGVLEVRRDSKNVGFLTKKRGFYRWLDHAGITRSKRAWEFEPDAVFVNSQTRTVHILEMKTQSTGGSVDEKLFGVSYRVKYYESYFENTAWRSKLHYVLAGSEFYEKKDTKYSELFKYILDCEAGYSFEPNFSLQLVGL
jgi:hypothetical protein